MATRPRRSVRGSPLDEVGDLVLMFPLRVPQHVPRLVGQQDGQTLLVDVVGRLADDLVPRNVAGASVTPRVEACCIDAGARLAESPPSFDGEACHGQVEQRAPPRPAADQVPRKQHEECGGEETVGHHPPETERRRGLPSSHAAKVWPGLPGASGQPWPGPAARLRGLLEVTEQRRPEDSARPRPAARAGDRDPAPGL